jgi:hypothetical protein
MRKIYLPMTVAALLSRRQIQFTGACMSLVPACEKSRISLFCAASMQRQQFARVGLHESWHKFIRGNPGKSAPVRLPKPHLTTSS